MTDLNKQTKTALNDMLAKPLSASALKKTAKTDLVAMVEAQKPKTRKPRELPDRVMIKPGKPEDVKATKAGSKRHLMAEALAKGATIEELMEELGWTKDTVSSAFRVDMSEEDEIVLTLMRFAKQADINPFEEETAVVKEEQTEPVR